MTWRSRPANAGTAAGVQDHGSILGGGIHADIPRHSIPRRADRRGRLRWGRRHAEINDDAALFRLITRDEPFGSYPLFPSTSEISSGRLDGAGAHPRARVRINAAAAGSLQNGRLPPGGRFANGSVIFKEVLGDNLYAVMRKADDPTSGAGWQWAEFRPDGSVVYSIAARGGSCIPCHSRQQGPVNDLVRTFERQQ
jgi:hypothetical protein